MMATFTFGDLRKLKYSKFVDCKHYTHKSQDFPKSSNVFQ